ncbi:hypothetical protein Psed_5225 [Pseudonocardia dioxanivorans CB1190]|uniref:Uncharacterized protein n=1 Tax=Pseudonocardia dioxanivorans (strain ATCC 55486 / DSM 44775 / JCM 13855 / CB1190) TaxID=675635 RepID=F4CTD6_PSEUX|nr:hypothetical protein [Pseudonocardia dioxanivorans]AEA27361.1 hypothetical protein Psed_5225 [Pseudonocardia dioxanivorans CB1190]
MSEMNRSSVAVPPQGIQADRPYRPTASREKVQEEIERAMRGIFFEAAAQATQYMSLVEYDRQADITVRHGHLVDASECMEIAMTYLGQLKALLSHRIRVENVDPPEQF